MLNFDQNSDQNKVFQKEICRSKERSNQEEIFIQAKLVHPAPAWLAGWPMSSALREYSGGFDRGYPMQAETTKSPRERAWCPRESRARSWSGRSPSKRKAHAVPRTAGPRHARTAMPTTRSKTRSKTRPSLIEALPIDLLNAVLSSIDDEWAFLCAAASCKAIHRCRRALDRRIGVLKDYFGYAAGSSTRH